MATLVSADGVRAWLRGRGYYLVAVRWADDTRIEVWVTGLRVGYQRHELHVCGDWVGGSAYWDMVDSKRVNREVQ